jgi:hypothetical protein
MSSTPWNDKDVPCTDSEVKRRSLCLHKNGYFYSHTSQKHTIKLAKTFPTHASIPCTCADAKGDIA